MGGSLAPPGVSVTCLLRIGERVVVRSSGPPDAEYALFEIGDIELQPSEHGRVREHGYQTTAGEARARLAGFGMTPALAEDIARTLQPVIADAYARGAGVRRVARYLGPAELFRSETLSETHVYEGAFLDLASLVRDLGLEQASATFQALYLAAILAKEDAATPIVLVTEELTRQAKPGARSYRRPTFADPQRLRNALGGLSHRAPKPRIRDTLRHDVLAAFLRERADIASDDDERALYRSLESSLSSPELPERSALASPEAAPDKRRTVLDLDVTAPKPSRPAAPEPKPADLTPKAPSVAPPADAVRPSRRPRLSGVVMETRPPPTYDPRAEQDDEPIAPRSPSSPANRRSSVTDLPRTTPLPPQRMSAPVPDLAFDVAQRERRIRSERPTLAETDAADTNEERPEPEPRERPYMHGASLPPYQNESPPPLLPRAPLLPRLASDELAEHLALPPGITGDQKPHEALPTSVLEARIQFTLLARELGLDYRLKRGIELRADVSGIEAMQAVLLESFPDHVVKSQAEAYELRRHGALLSEILSRKLEAEWLDITPADLGHWVMIVPPSTRVWPFGRIARLVAMGHRERDLVSYFLELKERARPR